MRIHPVITANFKLLFVFSACSNNFAVQIMQRTAEEFQFLSDSECLSEHDKSVYRELLESNMSETVFCGGLKILSKLLHPYYSHSLPNNCIVPKEQNIANLQKKIHLDSNKTMKNIWVGIRLFLYH